MPAPGTGVLSFGLVAIPVRIHTATKSESVSLHLLHKKCGSRVRNQYYCPLCNVVVEMETGRFREDLYYRLNVFEINIPPLRKRLDDLPGLIEHLIQRHNNEMNTTYKGIDSATMRILMSFPWKGNIRELDNVLERAMILGDGEWIKPADLPGQEGNGVNFNSEDNLTAALDLYEKSHIERTLNKAAGDKGRAAELMGLSLSTLYRKLEKLGIDI